MSTVAVKSSTAPVTTRPVRARAWLGPAGAGLLLVATAIIVVSLPNAAGPDGVEKVRAFYAEGGNHRIVPLSEPLALIGAFLMMWFSGTLREYLRQAGGDDRRATVAFTGSLAFAILLPVALLVLATPAGQLAFSQGFRLDPYTAMLFHHVGYVLIAAAMMGAAAVAAATGTVIRDTGILGRGMFRASMVVSVLSLLAMPFVYVPLVLFVIWVIAIGVRLPAALTER